MTETLTDETAAPVEEEAAEPESLLSDAERRPRHVATAPAAALASVATCPECGATFEGKMRNARLGRHRLTRHGIAGSSKGSKAAKKTTKKAAPAGKKPITAKAKEALATPVPVSKRKPAAEVISSFFGIGSKVVGVVDPPVGASLRFVAPAAGDAIDSVVAGSFVDRHVLQKMVSASDKWERFGAVMGLPVMIGIVTRSPVLFPALEEAMVAAVEEVMIASVPTLRRRHERQRKAVAAWDELGQLDPAIAQAIAAGINPAAAMLRGMLPEYVYNPQPPEEGDGLPGE